MKYLSLFSGIEAVTVACKGMNWQAVAFSEIADFPYSVLKHYYPDIPNLGDVRNISGAKYHGAIELVVGGSENYVLQNLRLRKLTPLECERLQGFPDNYTDIPYKGKQHAPLSKRYEAIGNSMAVPVVKWIFERINKVEKLLLNTKKN